MLLICICALPYGELREGEGHWGLLLSESLVSQPGLMALGLLCGLITLCCGRRLGCHWSVYLFSIIDLDRSAVVGRAAVPVFVHGVGW